MRVLVVGGGGREHALAWKLSNSPALERIFAIPGNGGLEELADCCNLPLEPGELADFAAKQRVDLTVIGPEAPLVAGVVDEFERRCLPIFGPNKAAAQLEGSKSFAKRIMQENGVPTGAAEIFTDYKSAINYLKGKDYPLVVKADGLAGGKGVVVAETFAEATSAVHACFVSQKFGPSGNVVLIEEFLSGQEVSLLAYCDGNTVLPMVPAQDYKRVYDGDRGPNTGGMGCYSPVPVVNSELFQEIVSNIIEPVIKALKAKGIDYRGVLYTGIILTDEGPKVLEFNARFGDPETQVILPLFESDLLEIMLSVTEKNLADHQLKWSDKKCVSVVLASAGYPERPQTGKDINGIDRAVEMDDVFVFHAGTVRINNRLVTSGGRVLNVSALGDTFDQARELAYEACSLINFEGMHYRHDIGKRAADLEVGVK